MNYASDHIFYYPCCICGRGTVRHIFDGYKITWVCPEHVEMLDLVDMMTEVEPPHYAKCDKDDKYAPLP